MSLQALVDPRSSILREHVLDMNDLADALDEAEAEGRRKAEAATKK